MAFWGKFRQIAEYRQCEYSLAGGSIPENHPVGLKKHR